MFAGKINSSNVATVNAPEVVQKKTCSNFLTGNVSFTDCIVSAENTTLYRAVEAPVESIMKTGFTGTAFDSPKEPCLFGKRTVFTSRSAEGVKEFIRMREKHSTEKSFYNLFKIDTDGQRYFSFSDNYKQFPESLIESFARKIEKLGHTYYPHARVQAQRNLEKVYVHVDEVHLEGPIPPKLITFIEGIEHTPKYCLKK